MVLSSGSTDVNFFGGGFLQMICCRVSRYAVSGK